MENLRKREFCLRRAKEYQLNHRFGLKMHAISMNGNKVPAAASIPERPRAGSLELYNPIDCKCKYPHNNTMSSRYLKIDLQSHFCCHECKSLIRFSSEDDFQKYLNTHRLDETRLVLANYLRQLF